MVNLKKGINDLETTFPNIAKDWDHSKNIGSPEDYTYRSMYKANWKCSICGHEWVTQIRDRVKSRHQLCPKCTLLKRSQNRHERELKNRGGITDPLLLKEWDYERNQKGPEEYTPKSNESVFWICSKCGYRFKSKISNQAIRHSCACCDGKTVVKEINDLATTHPKLVAEWHPIKNGELKPTDVTYGRATKVWWICPEGHEYQATLLHRCSKTGTNCPKCNSGRQTSFAEQAVYYYVKKVFSDALSRYKEIFSNSMELDIYTVRQVKISLAPSFSSYLTIRTLGFTTRLAMSTSATVFHRLDLCHPRHTKKRQRFFRCLFCYRLTTIPATPLTKMYFVSQVFKRGSFWRGVK